MSPEATALKTERPYETYAWILLLPAWIWLFIVGIVSLVPGSMDLCYGCGSEDLTQIQRMTGMSWSQLTTSNPGLAYFIFIIYSVAGLAILGFAILGISITLTSYRKGERWAWYVSWYLPAAILGWGATVSAVGEALPPFFVPLLIIIFLGLLLPLRRFFPRKGLIA